jgi:hypothetical protein
MRASQYHFTVWYLCGRLALHLRRSLLDIWRRTIG